MKVLLAGDWHGNLDQAKWVIDQAHKRGVSRIFQLGDFGAWEHYSSGVTYFDRLQTAAEKNDVTVYWLDGNHDKWSDTMKRYGENRDDEGFVICRPNVRYSPRGHVFTWDKVTFMTLGGAYSVDKQWRLEDEQFERRKRLDKARYGAAFVDPEETQWFPEEELTEEQVQMAIDAVQDADEWIGVDVLLTHDKPRSSNPRWNRKDFSECLPNQNLIEKAVHELGPKLLVHGHLHYRYADKIRAHGDYWTTVVGLNADPDAADGPGYTRYNNVIMLNLDPDTGWISLEEINPP